MGEDKTKTIFFASKRNIEKVPKLYIIYNNIQIRQYSWVTYQGFVLEETVYWESMTHEVVNKVNARWKFLHQKNKYLTPNLCRLLFLALVQPNFDYACSAQYLILSKNLKTKLQTSQNTWICLCLQLDKISHISQKEFETNVCPLEKHIISM